MPSGSGSTETWSVARGFSATGEVNLLGAHISGQLICTGGQFFNPDGAALTAARLTVDQDMYLR